MIALRGRWDRITQSSSRRPQCVAQKIRERKGPSQGIMPKCEPQELKSMGSQIRGKNARRNSNKTEVVHPQRRLGTVKGCSQTQGRVKRYVLLSCRSLGNASTLFEKGRGARHFVIDSGASMHMLSQKDLSSGESETLKRSTFPITVVTANGSRRMKKRKFLCMDLHVFVTLQLLEDTFAPQKYSEIKCREMKISNALQKGTKKTHFARNEEIIYVINRN